MNTQLPELDEQIQFSGSENDSQSPGYDEIHPATPLGENVRSEGPWSYVSGLPAYLLSEIDQPAERLVLIMITLRMFLKIMRKLVKEGLKELLICLLS